MATQNGERNAGQDYFELCRGAAIANNHRRSAFLRFVRRSGICVVELDSNPRVEEPEEPTDANTAEGKG